VITRLRLWLWQMLIGLDQVIGCWLRGWYYVWLGGDKPRADETISSWVGRRSQDGKHWAQAAEWAIDRAFFWQPPGHCFRAIEREDLDD
jgi:hypothetical protein